ncbi:Ig-like domain-containing protein [Agromyces sp. MMS24-K17]|uniref:Ig-like domain-containing protein n=1 Tax=Agromyces sp. MMS24-K17 TaxID=3372850 RepID=UPI003755252C
MPRQLTMSRSAAATGVATAVVVALVGAAAVMSGGYADEDVDLGDGSVWVVNDDLEAVGRAGTAVGELTSMVDTGSQSATIVQRSTSVLVHDPDRSSVAILDPATAELVETVPVPPDPERGQVAFAGDRAVVVAGGDVWITSLAGFADFDADLDPQLEFGVDARIVVDGDGTLFAYTPGTGQVQRVDAAARATVTQTWTVPAVDEDDEIGITSVGGRWVLLDASTSTMRTAERAWTVAGIADVVDEPVLQRPATSGDSVVVATRDALYEMPLDGSGTTRLADGRSGGPAAPVVHDGCVHAAWSDGVAWRSCADGVPRTFDLGGPVGDGLAYVDNGHALVLNDPASGWTWAATAGYERIDDWDSLLERRKDDRTEEQQDPDASLQVEQSAQPPVAVPDEFGARPGRSTLLPVLLNDYDANGDVLIVSGVSGVLPGGASVIPVSDRQVLQLTLDDGVAGTFAFGYSITDGRGLTASTEVVVTVRGDDENNAPVYERRTTADVEAQGRLTVPVLGGWVDPDGDPMYLKSARAEGADGVSWSPEGVVVFDERENSAQQRSVQLVVSDGRDDGAGDLRIEVGRPGETPLFADSFVATATAGEEIVLEPLRHVRGGSGHAKLSAVPATVDARPVPDYDGGTVRIPGLTAGTHYLEYTVTDGARTATGAIRLEVNDPPDGDLTPITVPHTAFLRVGMPGEVDVLATDIDPNGGVLVLTGVSAGAEEEGVQVEVVEHRILRITLAGPLPTGSAEVRYLVGNGFAQAEGRVTVIEVGTSEVSEPPVANEDRVTARTGDVVDIPVLANDESPGGGPLELSPELSAAPEAGLLFPSGDHLRFYAPEEPGEYRATYEVRSGEQLAHAVVVLAVREPDPATNTPPVPPEVTARAFSGETVRIPIPLSGTDPDGDSVQLLGQGSSPELGSVLEIGAGWLLYEAGAYSAGTDSFKYEVVDGLGKRAEGIVRVGISKPPATTGAPIAVADEIRVRPGRTVAVAVLGNDSDPGGERLSVTEVTPNQEGVDADIVDDRIVVHVPDTPGRLGFGYAIANQSEGTASSTLTIEVSEDADLARPVVADTVLALTDIVDREEVDVDVLANVAIDDAPVAEATVKLVPGYADGARVRADGSIRVEVQDRRRIIPFTVAHPDDPAVFSYAFIWVPGRDDALPQRRADAPTVKVASGEEVRIDLEDQVIAASGRPVRITDSASIRATHSDGSENYVDSTTLRFRSDKGYFGPASLSFTATDGASPSDPDARTGTIVIPIEVEPVEGQPPTFQGGVIDLEAGEPRTIDLVNLTNNPPPATDEGLSYTLISRPTGFDLQLSGTRLTITAGADAGKRGRVTIGVAGDGIAGTEGVLDLRVVASTRPLPRPVPDDVVAVRGETTVVDVLQNDGPGNPFPDRPLRVVAVRGADAASLPPGLTVDVTGDRSTLAITATADAPPGTATVQYQVADATNDPSRYAWGIVTISVRDRPGPVTDLRVTGFGDRRIDVSFVAGAFNNSPITGYDLALIDPGTGDRIAGSRCAVTTCSVTTPGNGQANAVLVRVTARNDVGESDPTTLGVPVWSDIVPAAPANLTTRPLDGRLAVAWSPVDSRPGSPVGTYVVTVDGVAVEVSAASACTATACTYESQPLVNGSVVQVAVSARNDAYPALAGWTSATAVGTPFGPPGAGSITAAADDAAGTVTVTWSPFDPNGDQIGGYYVQRLVAGDTNVPSGPQACTVTSPAPGVVVPPSRGGNVAEMVATDGSTTGVTFGSPPGRHAFIVWGFNRSGCAHTAVVTAQVHEPPGPVWSVSSRMDWLDATVWDRRIDAVAADQPQFEIVALDDAGNRIGAPVAFSGSGWLRELLGRPFGTTARFQVRACSAFGVCGPWSDPMPSGSTPSLTFDVPGLGWSSDEDRWTWAGIPDNSGLPASFSCGREGQPGRTQAVGTSCEVAGASQWDTVWLDVEVAGVVARLRNG